MRKKKKVVGCVEKTTVSCDEDYFITSYSQYIVLENTRRLGNSVGLCNISTLSNVSHFSKALAKSSGPDLHRPLSTEILVSLHQTLASPESIDL